MNNQHTFLQAYAIALEARENCIKSGNENWQTTWENRITELESNLPSGSGFDNGCTLLPESKTNRFVFSADFHHMNEAGYYEGWTEHKVIVKPCFQSGYQIGVTGRNKNNIKEYIADVFCEIFDREFAWENQ